LKEAACNLLLTTVLKSAILLKRFSKTF